MDGNEFFFLISILKRKWYSEWHKVLWNKITSLKSCPMLSFNWNYGMVRRKFDSKIHYIRCFLVIGCIVLCLALLLLVLCLSVSLSLCLSVCLSVCPSLSLTLCRRGYLLLMSNNNTFFLYFPLVTLHNYNRFVITLWQKISGQYLHY